LAWINTPRKQGGLGEMNIPLLADKSGKIARDYGVLDEESGIPFRGLFIIDDKQNLRQVTINDLPVGRYRILSKIYLFLFIKYCFI
jgi:peroxiredoxin 1